MITSKNARSGNGRPAPRRALNARDRNPSDAQLRKELAREIRSILPDIVKTEFERQLARLLR